MKKKNRLPPFAHISADTLQDVTPLSSLDITRRRIVVECEVEMLDAELHDLQMKLVDARRRHAKMAAVLSGLSSALSKRA